MPPAAIDDVQRRIDASESHTINALQAVRGLAAACVVLHHCCLYFATTPARTAWSYVLFNGHAAVTIFYVLSGFVLSAALYRRRIDFAETGKYFLRRAVRIYPALFLATLAAVLYYRFLWRLPPIGASYWFRAIEAGAAPDPLGFAKMALSGANNLVPVLWSIRIELIASLLMPAAALALRRSEKAAWAFVVLGVLLVWAPRLEAAYMADFLFGAAIGPATRVLSRWSDRARLAVACCGFMGLLAVRPLIGMASFDPPALILSEGLCAFAVLAPVAARPSQFPVLCCRPFVALGDISYSLYLLHWVVLATFGKLIGYAAPGLALGHPGWAATLLAAAVLGVTLPLAALSYRFVELPGIALGKALSGRLSGALPSSGR